MDDERKLVQRARSGDRSAFREIVNRHKRNIYYLALSMTANHHDAEDISQEVFIKAFRSLKGFRGKSQLGSWLYRIAVNACLDRKKAKFPTVLDYCESGVLDEAGNGAGAGGAQQDNPELHVEAVQIARHIEEALKSLTVRERTVFILRHYNDLPLKDVAEILSISIGTVKSLLFRAVKKLQKELLFYQKEIGMENIK